MSLLALVSAIPAPAANADPRATWEYIDVSAAARDRYPFVLANTHAWNQGAATTVGHRYSLQGGHARTGVFLTKDIFKRTRVIYYSIDEENEVDVAMASLTSDCPGEPENRVRNPSMDPDGVGVVWTFEDRYQESGMCYWNTSGSTPTLVPGQVKDYSLAGSPAVFENTVVYPCLDGMCIWNEGSDDSQVVNAMSRSLGQPVASDHGLAFEDYDDGTIYYLKWGGLDAWPIARGDRDTAGAKARRPRFTSWGAITYAEVKTTSTATMTRWHLVEFDMAGVVRNTIVDGGAWRDGILPLPLAGGSCDSRPDPGTEVLCGYSAFTPGSGTGVCPATSWIHQGMVVRSWDGVNDKFSFRSDWSQSGYVQCRTEADGYYGASQIPGIAYAGSWGEPEKHRVFTAIGRQTGGPLNNDGVIVATRVQ